MQVIDAHQHLWDTSQLKYPWLEEPNTFRTSYQLNDYHKAFGEIDIIKSVHVEADPGPGAEIAEVDMISRISSLEGTIGAIVAAAPLEIDGKYKILDAFKKNYPRVVGIRRMAWHHQDPTFYRWPALIEGVKALPEYGYSFELCANVTQLEAALYLVEATPNVSHAINHCGGPDIAANGFQPWATYMRQIADFPNTVCKISGLVTRANMEWTPGDLKPYIEYLIEIFGFDRVMFGSDWPVCTLAGTYKEWFDALNQVVRKATEEDRKKLFHDNAQTFYRLS